MPDDSIEISVGGKWVRVPALDVNGKTIVVKGEWIKVAVIHDEEWLGSELEDPGLCLKRLREHRSNGLAADIFSFSQKPPARLPQHAYSMEWDSIAGIQLTSGHKCIGRERLEVIRGYPSSQVATECNGTVNINGVDSRFLA